MIRITRTTTIVDPCSNRKICFEDVYTSHEMFPVCWECKTIGELKHISIARELKSLSPGDLIKIREMLDKYDQRNNQRKN